MGGRRQKSRHRTDHQIVRLMQGFIQGTGAFRLVFRNEMSMFDGFGQIKHFQFQPEFLFPGRQYGVDSFRLGQHGKDGQTGPAAAAFAESKQ